MSLGDPLRKLAEDAHQFEADWPLEGAHIFEAEASRQANEATGGDGTLSRWPEIGTAATDVQGSVGAASMAAVGALWRVLEDGTNAHDIHAAQAKALSTPYGPRKRVYVRGRPAMNTWSHAAAIANTDVQQMTMQAFDQLGS